MTQVARLRARRHGDCISGADSEVAEAEYDEPDEQEAVMRPGVSARFRLSGACGRRLGLRRDSGSCIGLGLVGVEPRQPLEPLRQVPVPVAEQLHRRRQEHGADDRRVDQDRRREPDAELLEERHRERAEDREDADHDDRGAGDDAGGGLDAVRDRVVHALAAIEPPRGSG